MKVRLPSRSTEQAARRPRAPRKVTTEAGLPRALDARAVLDLQRKTGNANVRRVLDGARSLVATVVTSGSGRPLDDVIRTRLEDRFGLDLTSVRIHTDELASESAGLLGAHAYAVGDDIVFQKEHYRPHSEAGLRMLTHEIAHVAQQRAAPLPARSVTGGVELVAPTNRLEKDADRAAHDVSAHSPNPLPERERARSH